MDISLPMNILVTLDANYLFCLNTMLTSLLYSNPDRTFRVYLMHSSITEAQVSETRRILDGRGELILLKAEESGLEDAPTTARYPKEIYYRIFAARYLPGTLDRVLYLDPDIIVNGRLDDLYALSMGNYYFAAASHVGEFLSRFNQRRLDMGDNDPYINSGVMLMNLALLRAEQDENAVFRFMQQHRRSLLLPDQDVISGLYGSRIYPLDPFRYNMTERLYARHAPFEKGFDLDWVRSNAVIIHYCGRNKPWKDNYIGQLSVFYQETQARMGRQSPPSDEP